MKNSTITLLVIAGILLLVLFNGCGSYNKMVDNRNGVDKAWAQVENVYQRRMDLIPNLVNTVKGSANFEKSTLTEITEMRSRVGQAKVNWDDKTTSPETRMKAAKEMESSLSRLLVIAENYPQLKSTQAFTDLMSQLEGTESRVSTERGKFNESVQVFNTSIQKFPQNIYAGIFNFKAREFFKGNAGSEKAPEVQFNQIKKY